MSMALYTAVTSGASERLAQLIHSSGGARRSCAFGEVILQTHHPEHGLLQALLHKDYHQFRSNGLSRAQTGDVAAFTPLATLFRAEANDTRLVEEFLRQVRHTLVIHPLFDQYCTVLGQLQHHWLSERVKLGGS